MKKSLFTNIFANIPTIETDRLILRKLSVADADDMYDYSKDENVTKFLTWSPHPDRYYTMDYIKFVQKKYKTGDFRDWAVIDKATGKMIGTCGFTSVDLQNKKAEIGYVYNSDFWGKGIATEALQKVIEFGFSKLDLNRIEGRFMVENTPSRHVMEKCGMTFEGVHRQFLLIKGKYRDVGFCAILRGEYENTERKNDGTQA
jgi:ribosomal-protein-alanine N-acetyltransferase